METFSIYIGVIAVGFLHGLEPGHGWPIAFLYSIRRETPMLYGLLTSGILASFHFLSSIAVVVVYVIVSAFIPINLAFLNYIAAAVLFLMAIMFWREKVEDEMGKQHEHLHGNEEALEHEHEHKHLNGETHIHFHQHAKSIKISISALIIYSFLLGFAHEEEFALLALIAAGLDPWLLMISYALAVSGGLIGITLLCLQLYKIFLPKLQKYQKYIPKISAIILVVMAVLFLFNII